MLVAVLSCLVALANLLLFPCFYGENIFVDFPIVRCDFAINCNNLSATSVSYLIINISGNNIENLGSMPEHSFKQKLNKWSQIVY